MTVAVNGHDAILTYSSGSPDTGTIEGNHVSDEGVMKTNSGLVKATGTLQLSPDGNSLIKYQAAYYPDEIKTTGVEYARLSRPSNGAPKLAVAEPRDKRSGGQSGSAQQFVQSFYTWYAAIANSTANKGPACEIAVARRPDAFSEKLYRELKKETAQARSIRRVGLGFDPILNSQDPASRYTVGNVSHDGKHENVDVYAVYDDGRRERAVRARVKQQHGHWAFTDFVYPDGSSLKKQLRSEEG